MKQKIEQQKRGTFQLNCLHCKHPVTFEVLDLQKEPELVVECSCCNKKYVIGDEALKRQLAQFARLCKEIRASEEILGSTSIAVDVGPHSVKIPFKILLTRLKSTLDLKVGSERITVVFRTEPCALSTKKI